VRHGNNKRAGKMRSRQGRPLLIATVSQQPAYGWPEVSLYLLAEVALAHSPLVCILTATGL
jgi:hypothetical protein